MSHHIGLISKVIPLKLFLDMVPSSTEDITRAMRGQPKGRNDEMAGNSVKSHFFTFNEQNEQNIDCMA